MANNPISFVDPDGGKSIENDQTKAAREKARREFEEWWSDINNRLSFRHRGAVNLFYHENNLATFGHTDFDALDLNEKGWDGSIWSGKGNGGWGPVMKQMYGIDSYDMRENMSGQSSIAMTQTMDDIASQQFATLNGKWNAIKQFAQEVVDNNGELVFDENGNVIGYNSVDIEIGEPIYDKVQSSLTGLIYNVGDIRGYQQIKVINFHEFNYGNADFSRDMGDGITFSGFGYNPGFGEGTIDNLSKGLNALGFISAATLKRVDQIIKESSAYVSETTWLHNTTILKTELGNVKVSNNLLKGISSTAKTVGYIAGGLGYVITGYQYFNDQISGSEAILDLSVGTAGMIGGEWGQAISIGYFGLKSALELSGYDLWNAKIGAFGHIYIPK